MILSLTYYFVSPTWPCARRVCARRCPLLCPGRDSVPPRPRGPLCPRCGSGRRRSSGWMAWPDVLCCCKPERLKWREGVVSKAELSIEELSDDVELHKAVIPQPPPFGFKHMTLLCQQQNAVSLTRFFSQHGKHLEHTFCFIQIF